MYDSDLFFQEFDWVRIILQGLGFIWHFQEGNGKGSLRCSCPYADEGGSDGIVAVILRLYTLDGRGWSQTCSSRFEPPVPTAYRAGWV
jgi:hypothetical protein